MVLQGGSANCVPARLRIRGKANALTNTCPGYTNPDLRHESCVGATFALLALSRIDLSAATPLHIPPDLYSYRAYLMRWLVIWDGRRGGPVLLPQTALRVAEWHPKALQVHIQAVSGNLHHPSSACFFRSIPPRVWTISVVKPSSRTFAFTTPSGH